MTPVGQLTATLQSWARAASGLWFTATQIRLNQTNPVEKSCRGPGVVPTASRASEGATRGEPPLSILGHAHGSRDQGEVPAHDTASCTLPPTPARP